MKRSVRFFIASIAAATALTWWAASPAVATPTSHSGDYTLGTMSFFGGILYYGCGNSAIDGITSPPYPMTISGESAISFSNTFFCGTTVLSDPNWLGSRPWQMLNGGLTGCIDTWVYNSSQTYWQGNSKLCSSIFPTSATWATMGYSQWWDADCGCYDQNTVHSGTITI